MLIRKLGTLAVGIIVLQTLNWLFDYILYPFVIYKLGLWQGGIVMTILSMVTCLVMLWFYDVTRQDWLGIETFKTLRETTGSQTFIKRHSTGALRKGNTVAFIFLSTQFDPFITVAYMRQGAFQFNGMSLRDWKLFFASLLVGNGYWTLTVFLGVSLLEWLCIHLKPLFA